MTEQRVTPIFEGHDNVCTITETDHDDEAAEFLASLAPADQAKFNRYLERLRDGHHVQSPENMRHVKQVVDPREAGAEVHELKVHRNGGLRLYVVRFENRWYATHGLKKKPSDKDVPKQAKRAYRIFWDQ